jgi:GTP cyclohydrolase II
LPADARVYNQVKDVFDFFHINKVELMTNNPDKINAVKGLGIEVLRYPVKSRIRKQNLTYLSTKVEKMGHQIDLDKNENE